MHKHLEQGSKRYFRQAGAIFFPFPFIYRSLTSSSLPLIAPLSFSPLLWPSFFFTAAPASDRVVSQLTGWHTSRRGTKSPRVGGKHTHARTSEAVNACNQTQTRACAAAHHTHTHATQEGTDEGTHFQSPPASGLPTLHLINPL